jgi:NAD(P)-dependent dehydrogenase (short-subunit alcohol dehydrogenase family)
MTRVAVVTGATGEVGPAAAIRLAESGLDVALIGPDPTCFEETARRISAAGRRCLGLEADPADTASFESAVGRVRAELGSPAVLLTGVPLGVRADELPSPEHYVTAVRQRLRTLFVSCRATTAHMARQKWGRVVTVGVLTGSGADVWRDSQTVLAGLAGFTKSVAVELAAFGITANYIAPLACATNPRPPVHPAAGATGSYPADVAHVTGFLIDDRAGAITGQGTYVGK